MNRLIGTDVDRAAALLRSGQLVAIPTETVYGLAADALNDRAVARIFEAKQRPRFDPLIVHAATVQDVGALVQEIPPAARALAGAFWPGPLTLLLPRKPRVPDLVTAGLSRVAVRVPAHALTRRLLGLLDFPLAAPSANPFGYISPTTAQHVADQLGQHVAYILDGGAAHVGVESTIVGWEDGRTIVYRVGGLSVEQLEAVVGPVEVRVGTSDPGGAVVSPGTLRSHYAPRKPLRLGALPQLLAAHAPDEAVALCFQTPTRALPPDRQVVLSPTGDLRVAARRLFAALRQLDALPGAVILAEPVPDEGLGRAINDRLQRAAAE